MDYLKLNRLVYQALETLSPVSTSRVSMFDLENQYDHPPFLRFKFKNKLKDDKLYERLKDAIESFQGCLKWQLVTSEDTENYIIFPILIDKNDIAKYLNQKEYYLSILGQDSYNRQIEEAIQDIPKLAKTISSCKYETP